jgi:D-alanine-D-alanine ligase
MAKKLRVGVVFGGRSGEHEVSLVSARSVMAAIPRDRYEVVPIGITREGRWIAGDAPMAELEAEVPPTTPAALLPEPGQRALQHIGGGSARTLSRAAELDVVFPVLHGPNGEDGTIQGLLELADVPYVGCGVLASALCMDKIAFKDVMRANGIPVVEHVALSRREILAGVDAAADAVEASLAYPVFCKPANMGSSVGVSRADDRAGLLAGLAEAARWDRRVLVERGVDAREIEVSVLGNDAPEASVAGEIVPCNDFYDYEAKYKTGDASELHIPAKLPAALMDRMRAVAVQAFQLADCAGLARVDFLLERGSDLFYLNEINTLPGFTAISMYPKLWAATGVDYPELLHRLIQLALERHAEKQSITRVFRSG